MTSRCAPVMILILCGFSGLPELYGATSKLVRFAELFQKVLPPKLTAIRVGASRESVIQALGKPAEIEAGILLYQLGTRKYDLAIFMKDDRVEGWRFEPDPKAGLQGLTLEIILATLPPDLAKTLKTQFTQPSCKKGKCNSAELSSSELPYLLEFSKAGSPRLMSVRLGEIR